jgi:hypothetical protein
MTTMATRLPHKAADVAAALAKCTKGVSRKSRKVIREIAAPYLTLQSARKAMKGDTA